jgi:hypothetical protein
MSLLGKAAVTIWQDAPAEARGDYYAWHNGEHMPERVGIPGFLRGRRYIALEGEPQFFTLYEAADMAVLAGEDYAARLNNPTPWTRRVAPRLYNNVRSLCEVAYSRGQADGGLMMTWRFDVAKEGEAQLRARLDHVLSRLAEQPGIAAVHLCVADTAASSVQSEEKKARPRQALVPSRVILIEGCAGRAELEAACSVGLDAQALAAAGAQAPVARGIYQLQIALAAG